MTAKHERSIGTQKFISYIQNRIKKNKNFLACITGQTGSGKSYAALSLMEELNGRINHDNVCLTTKTFMERINSGDLKKGDVIIWDEAGVNINAKQWQSMSNRVVNYLLQTFRNMNLIVIFTLPYFSFLDSDSRKLLHCRMETGKIDKGEKSITLKPLMLQVSQYSGKSYNHYLKVPLKHKGRLHKVKKIKLYKINDDDLEVYEAIKTDFTEKLNKQIEEDLRKSMEKQEAKKIDRRHEAFKKLLKVLVKQGMTHAEIAEKTGYDRTHVTRLINSLENSPSEPDEGVGDRP